MTAKVQISHYPKVVSSVHDLQKSAQVVSLSNSQRLAAVGCSGEVRIIRIDSPTGMTDMCSHTTSPANASITDLGWSPVDLGKLAIAYANGSITCLNVAEKASRQSQILTEVWSSGKVSNGINRLCWHPFEATVLGTANQDGVVRLFDLRTTPAKVTSFGSRGFSATRDMEFDPFHGNIFAEVSENGSLKVWDRRVPSTPLITKLKAHSGPILSVSWSPSWEWVLATGSKDKAVKIWDLSECADSYQEDDSPGHNVFANAMQAMSHSSATITAALQQAAGSAANSPGPATSANGNSNHSNNSGKDGSTFGSIEPVLVNTLFTPAEVSRLKWSITAAGNSAATGNATIAPLLATIATGAGTGAESAGHILVWDLLNQYLPLCILKGHGQDMCADFAWLNHTNLPAATGAGAGASASAVTSALTASGASSRKGGGRGGGAGASAKQPDARRRAQTDTTGSSLSVSEKTTPADSPIKQLNPVTSLVIGILSTGRDGKVLMQDLRFGYFPNHHISPSVTAISSQGHVAFQRGYVHKKFSTSVRSPYYFDTYASYCAALAVFRKREAPETAATTSLPTLRNTNSSESLTSYAVNASSSGKSTQLATTGAGTGAESVSTKSKGKPATLGPADGAVVQDRRTGMVFFGSQTFLSLEDAKRIRLERAAEARVTDPALIAMFARQYRMPYTLSAEGLSLPPVDAPTGGEESEDAEEVDAALRERQLLERKLQRLYQLALRACQSNLDTAMSAGLHCRVAVWTTLLSLLPMPQLPASAAQVEEVALPAGISPPDLLRDTTTYTQRSTPVSSAIRNSDLLLSPHSSRHDMLSNTGGKAGNKVAARESFPELPFTHELIGTLISELLEGGDVQHFVVACEILRTGSVLPEICQAVNLSETRVQRGYLVYLDLLTKLGLFCEANDLLKASDDKYLSTLNKAGVQVGIKCATCGKELSPETATGWCERCARCVSICVVCNRPATGLVHWCPLCAHGGHLACTKRWFQQSDDCPAGCGHNCCGSQRRPQSSQERPAYRRMEALFELEYCLRSASNGGTRSRSGTNAQRPHSLSQSSHLGTSAGALTAAGLSVSQRTVHRQMLKQRKLAAMQAAGHYL